MNITLNTQERVSISLALEVALEDWEKKLNLSIKTWEFLGKQEEGSDYQDFCRSKIAELQAINAKLGFGVL